MLVCASHCLWGWQFGLVYLDDVLKHATSQAMSRKYPLVPTPKKFTKNLEGDGDFKTRALKKSTKLNWNFQRVQFESKILLQFLSVLVFIKMHVVVLT